MLQRQEQMWSDHLCKIKGVLHNIELNPGTRSIIDQTTPADPYWQVLIEQPVTNMFAAEVIEPVKTELGSLNIIAQKKDKTLASALNIVGWKVINHVLIPDYAYDFTA